MPDELPPTAPPPSDGPPAAGGNGEAFEPLNIADELKDSYLTYAMSVIISRALPDVRDGLKPSQRRILVAMHDLNLGPNSATSRAENTIVSPNIAPPFGDRHPAHPGGRDQFTACGSQASEMSLGVQ